MKISVIIPTLNSSEYIEDLLTSLEEQTVAPSEIVIIDSESDDNTVKLAKSYNNVRVINVKRNEFDHGKTRDLALRNTSGDFVLFLTHDALPANSSYIENIIRPFEDDLVVGVSGRQLPKKDAKPQEILIREFNYPPISNVRSKEDIPKLGIKTFFFSDACSAVRKNKYIELGGFDYPIKTDEDLFFAAKAIKNGYKIAYEAKAEVYHSHNLSYKEQYKRNFIQGVEFKNHKELLADISLESEGLKMVKFVTAGLLKQGKIISLIDFYFDCFARLMGSKAGRR